MENFAQLMKYSARNDLVCSEYSWGKNRHFISLCFLPFCGKHRIAYCTRTEVALTGRFLPNTYIMALNPRFNLFQLVS